MHAPIAPYTAGRSWVPAFAGTSGVGFSFYSHLPLIPAQAGIQG